MNSIGLLVLLPKGPVIMHALDSDFEFVYNNLNLRTVSDLVLANLCNPGQTVVDSERI